MKKMSVLLMLSLLLLVGCTGEVSDPAESVDTSIYEDQISLLNSQINTLEQEILDLTNQLEMWEESVEESTIEEPITVASLSSSLIASAVEVITYLSENDMDALSEKVHPTNGVRFSPYGYVQVSTDLVFSAQSIENLWNDPQTYNWGQFDGTGDPILFNFQDYYNRFVYSKDFLNPHMIGVDTVLSFGNTLVNFDVVYPNASFVEFHFTGFDPQFMGMDWRSLFLIFEEVNNEWFLIGIVNNEWTI